MQKDMIRQRLYNLGALAAMIVAAPTPSGASARQVDRHGQPKIRDLSKKRGKKRNRR